MNYAEQMKEAIKEAIEEKFGKINDCGCYSGIGGEWLSTESIFEIVCNAIDDNDWLFIEEG